MISCVSSDESIYPIPNPDNSGAINSIDKNIPKILFFIFLPHILNNPLKKRIKQLLIFLIKTRLI
jgi:hypothetical protein